MNVQDLLIPIAHAAEAAAESKSPGGVLGTLGINWKLFLAQLINFSILLLILWKFVFRPVAKKLEERSSKIEKSLNDASRIEKEKQEFFAWRDVEMTKVRSQSSAIITSAQAEAQKVKEQLSRETKLEQGKIVQQAKQQIEDEKRLALQSAKGELADLVTNATEKIIRHKLTKEKDEELIKEMLKSI